MRLISKKYNILYFILIITLILQALPWRYGEIHATNQIKAYAIFDLHDKSLTFFKDNDNRYDNKEVIGNKIYYTDIEKLNVDKPENIPWYSNRNNIEKINFKNAITPISTAYWFYGMDNKKLKSIENLDRLDTSETKNMKGMFYNCNNLQKIDTSHFDTSKTENLSWMFYNCYNINTAITIRNNLLKSDRYTNMCHDASKKSGKLDLHWAHDITEKTISNIISTRNNGNILNNGHVLPITKKDTKTNENYVQSKTINNTKITITDTNNNFTKNDKLSIKEIKNDKKITGLIKHNKNKNVALSYTFDIKILNKNNKEIQPNENVKISFTDILIKNKNLKTNIYHFKETKNGLKAEKLNTEKKGKKISTTTDGFSYYTVEFTYDDKQYVLDGGKTVKLDTILDKIGLTGDVSDVKVSNEKLFSAKKENDEWIIESHKAFKTNEWMRITIDGVEYEIKVTDDIQNKTITVTKEWEDGLTGENAENREAPEISLSYETSEPEGKAYAEFDSSTSILRIFRDDADKYTNEQTDGTKIYYAGFEDITGQTNPKWYDKRYSVTKVIIEDVFKPKNAYHMFYQMENLTEIEGIENINTSECINMYMMFNGCENITELDVSHFDTSNVANMAYMFSNCKKLTELDVSHFNTSNVTRMQGMFLHCENLENLDLSHFDTSKVTDMMNMFGYCYNLTATLNVMKMPTSYSNMCRYAAKDSGRLTLKYISPVTSADIDTLVATKDGGDVVNGGRGTFRTPTAPTPPTQPEVQNVTITSNDNNWTKVNDNIWSYTFTVPYETENLKVWESERPEGYQSDADENHKKTITNNSTTITNSEYTSTLSYNNGGHGTAPDNVTMKYSEQTIVAKKIQADGYRFTGWKRSDNDQIIQPGAIIKDEYEELESLTLTAQWEARETSDIEIEKETDIVTADKFDFTINFTKNSAAYDPEDTTGLTKVTNGEYTFSLGNGEKIILTGLPIDVQYEITKSPKEHWELSAIDDDTTPTTLTGNMGDDRVHVFYNDSTAPEAHNMTVNKTWVGDNENIRPDSMTIHATKTDAIMSTSGNALSNTMSTLAGGSANVTAFKKGTQSAAQNASNKQNVSSSGEPVYMWFDNGTIYWYSDALNVFLPENSSLMFHEFNNITDISGLSEVNTSFVTNMFAMFRSCYELTNLTPLTNWDTANVESMRFMFGSSTLPSKKMKYTSIAALENWNTQSVTDMSSMFKGGSITSVTPIKDWNVSNVAHMNSMFFRTKITNASVLAGWNTERVGQSYVNASNGNTEAGNFKQMFQNINDTTTDTTTLPVWTARPGEWTENSAGYNDTEDGFPVHGKEHVHPNRKTTTNSFTTSEPTSKTGNTWQYKINVGSDSYKWNVYETVPDGYTISGQGTQSNPIIKDNSTEFNLTNTLNTKNITLKANWDDDNNARNIRPINIGGFVKYTYNSKEITEFTTENWTINGNAWTYDFSIPTSATVTDWGEVSVPQNYSFTNKTSSTNLYEFTNELLPEIHFYSGVDKATHGIIYHAPNTNIEPTTPATLTGWTFTGWRDDTTAGPAEYTGSNFSYSGSSDSFYAIYQRTLTINYASGGGSGTAPANTTAVQYYNSGAEVTNTTTPIFTLAANTFSKTGYTFNSWDLGAENSTYTGWKPNENDTTITKTATAQWEANTGTITYDKNANDATGTTPASSYTYGITDSLSENNYSRTGYTFAGWNTNSEGTGTTYQPYTTYDSIKTLFPVGSGTVFAQWQEKTATLTYNNGGHGTAPSSVTMRYTTATNAASAISASGYRFKGWKRSDNGNVISAGVQVKAANVEPANLTLTAQWEKEITITKQWEDNLTETAANNRSAPEISLSYKKLASEPEGEAYAEFDDNTGVLRIFRDDAGKYTNGQTDGTKTYYAGIEDIKGQTDPKWYSKKYSVTKVIIEDGFKPKTTYRMFGYMTNLTEIKGIENFDTSKVTNMSNMFYWCGNLENLDVSHFDTSEVTDMYSMFFKCNNLTELDLNHFDTSNVTDIRRMFYNCYNLTATLNIMNMPEYYDNMCENAAKDSGQLTLKYISPVTSANIDTLVATKTDGNVVNSGEGIFTPPVTPKIEKIITSNDNNWVKVDRNTWTYTFAIPEDAENLKTWESEIPINYETDTDENHKKTITGNTATITNTDITIPLPTGVEKTDKTILILGIMILITTLLLRRNIKKYKKSV